MGVLFMLLRLFVIFFVFLFVYLLMGCVDCVVTVFVFGEFDCFWYKVSF